MPSWCVQGQIYVWLYEATVAINIQKFTLYIGFNTFSVSWIVRRFEVFILQSFWNVTPCGWVHSYQHFGGICCVHRQGRRVSLLVSLLFYPEDGGSRFLQNVAACSILYVVPRL